jgi:site-specific DNA-adenine methylase
MACYQGGKQKIGKYIYDVLIETEKKYSYSKLEYLEPFVGFCGVIKHFSNDSERKIHACDLNPDIIEMWRALQQNWVPDGVCDKEKFERLRNQIDSSPEKTLYGFVCSYGGAFFKGFLSEKYATRGAVNILKIKDKILNVNFMDAISYEKLEPNNMLIYCDPPYKNNKLSNTYFRSFDHDKFWNVMRKWSKNNLVVISEFVAPVDFHGVWEMSRPSLAKNNGERHTEKLFVHETIIKKAPTT